MRSPNNFLGDELTNEAVSILDENALRRVFKREKHSPEIEILQSGFITPDVSYTLVNGRVPHTREEFYAVNISTVSSGNGLKNWLGSGVFWTYHEAKSYLHYLQSEGLHI